jgi:hypothetical protein
MSRDWSKRTTFTTKVKNMKETKLKTQCIKTVKLPEKKLYFCNLNSAYLNQSCHPQWTKHHGQHQEEMKKLPGGIYSYDRQNNRENLVERQISGK